MFLIPVVLRVEWKWSWEASNGTVDLFQLNYPSQIPAVVYSVLVCWGCHNEVPWTGWLKGQQFIFPQFRKLEVWAQSVSRVAFIWSLFSWLTDGCLLPVPPQGLSLRESVLISHLCKDTSRVVLEPTLMTSFELIDLFKDPSPKYSHTSRCWGGQDSNI